MAARKYTRPKRYRAMKKAMLKFYGKKKGARIAAATFNKTRKKGQKAISRKRGKARYR